MPNFAPLARDGCALVVIDVQEKLLPAIYEFQQILGNAAKLIKGARLLEIPVVFTQQYTKGLGPTHSQLQEAAGEFTYVEKTDFNAFREPCFVEVIQGLQAENLVMIGTEAHICVCQTALEGLHRGYGVHVLADAVGSRAPANKKIGLARIRQAGGVISATELALYEWVGRADCSEFRAILPLIK